MAGLGGAPLSKHWEPACCGGSPFKGLLGIMRHIVILAAMVLALGVLVARLADRTVHAPAASAALAAQAAPASTSNSRMVTISRGNGGHFWAEARVDGRRLELLVDTGASQVALRASDAAQLGIHPSQHDYSIKVATANGMTRVALVQLGMIEIGNIVVRDVPAVVHADEGLGVSLLGMSFLSRVRFTHDRGKLVLEQ
jgi:aspartyl protease family protein